MTSTTGRWCRIGVAAFFVGSGGSGARAQGPPPEQVPGPLPAESEVKRQAVDEAPVWPQPG